MLAAQRDALMLQQVAQYPVARKRAVQMQIIDLSHEREVPDRNRTWLVVHCAAAYVQRLGLLLYGQLRCSRSIIALCSAIPLCRAPL